MAELTGLMEKGSRVRARLATDDRLIALVRRGDTAAFEALYERHSGPLLSFCIYMLGSRHDAEDATQASFASAYRALRADDRPVNLRPWLFTIARNECLTILRRRRPTVELNGEPALGGDPFRELEVREELRQMLNGLRELPERQRAALVLTEVHGLSQLEIGGVLGVRSEQVKAYVYQARSNLIADRSAREDDCREIREELASARGAALLRGRLRRHVRSCSDCRVYADGVARQRRQLGALVPVAPSLMLKYRTLEDALNLGGGDPATYAGGAAVGGSVAGLAGGGVKALAVKMAAGMAVLGAGAGVGAAVIGVPLTAEQPSRASATVHRAQQTLRASTGERGTAANGSPLSPSSLGVAVAPPITAADGRPPASRPQNTPAPASEPGSPGPAPGNAGPAPTGTEPAGGNPEHSAPAREPVAKAPHESEEERQKAREASKRRSEELELKNEERQVKLEAARQAKREEREARGLSGTPKSREERQQIREERHTKGLSRPPKSKEERQRMREERERRRKEQEEQQ